jgi:hypothetical protein
MKKIVDDRKKALDADSRVPHYAFHRMRFKRMRDKIEAPPKEETS